eukprot:6432729-Prymnesium_polylepis.1
MARAPPDVGAPFQVRCLGRLERRLHALPHVRPRGVADTVDRAPPPGALEEELGLREHRRRVGARLA